MWLSDPRNDEFHRVAVGLTLSTAVVARPLFANGTPRVNGLSRRENSFMLVFSLRGTRHVATGTAGLPCTTVIGDTERVTTLPAVTTAPCPMVTLDKMIAPGPINASRSILTPSFSSL